MRRAFSLVVVALAGAVLLVGTGMSQDTRKVKGMLPAGWKALELSPAQKEKVYTIQSTYRDKIAALEKQLDDIKAAQSAEMVSVLTDAQKEKLRRFLLGGLDGKDLEKKSEK